MTESFMTEVCGLLKHFIRIHFNSGPIFATLLDIINMQEKIVAMKIVPGYSESVLPTFQSCLCHFTLELSAYGLFSCSSRITLGPPLRSWLFGVSTLISTRLEFSFLRVGNIPCPTVAPSHCFLKQQNSGLIRIQYVTLIIKL